MKNILNIIVYLHFSFRGLRTFLYMLLLFLMFGIVSVIIMDSDDVRTTPVGWGKQKILSPAGTGYGNVSADKKGNLLASVYEGHRSGLSKIYISVSFDEGKSFVRPVKIAEFQSKIKNNPRVAISKEGYIYVVWHHLVDSETDGRIFLSYSKDFGATWSAPERITFGMQMEILPSIKFDGKNRLHLFFMAHKGSVFNLFHAYREGGEGFTGVNALASLDGTLRGAFFPAVKFSGRRVFVVWQGKEKNFTDHLYSVRSDDYGESWSDVDKITTGKFNNQAPSIEVVDDMVYLVYMNNSKKNWSIRMLRGNSSGTRWYDPVEISETNANCYSPHISLSPDNELIVTWNDVREKGSRIFYRRYSIRERQLREEKKLSVTNRVARNSLSVRTGNNLAVFWQEAGRIVVNHSDVYADPPEVFSSTHKENRWTRRTDAVIQIRKPYDDAGIAGYATLINNNPDTNPSIQNYRFDTKRISLSGLDDGITYFHIRTIDGAGNMSRTIHYRLQVSSNPLAMPVIVSSSHPESEKSLLKDGVLRWAVNDTRRLKGFLYSFTKGEAVKPAKFIKNFELPLNDLENGLYFFNLASVSRTNQISRVATYSFIVGAEGKFDPEYMKKIANREYRFRNKKRTVPKIPGVQISLPFNEAVPFTKKSFNAILRTVNIPGPDLSEYSVVIGKNKEVPPERINLKNNILKVSDLNNGTYSVGVRARYSVVKRGRRVYLWTKPVFRQFSVSIPVVDSPFGRFYQMVTVRIGESPLMTGIFAVFFTLAVLLLGFGNRIVFYFNHMGYRMRLYLR